MDWKSFVAGERNRRRANRLERYEKERADDRAEVERIDEEYNLQVAGGEDAELQRALLESARSQALEDPRTRSAWKKETIDPEEDMFPKSYDLLPKWSD